jgi:hypothetical protein
MSAHSTPLHCNVPTILSKQYDTATKALTVEAFECTACGILLTRAKWVKSIRRRSVKLASKAMKLEMIAKEVEANGLQQ